MNNLILRSITGLVLVTLMITSIWWSKYSSAALFFVINAIGTVEMLSLMKKGGQAPQNIPSILLSLLVFSLPSASILGFISNDWPIYLIPIAFGMFIAELYRKQAEPATNIALSLVPAIYISLPLALLYQTAFTTDYNGVMIIGFFVLIWINDTFAYLFGMALGKHKLFERISPKKTWEGFVGGALSTLVFSYFLTTITGAGSIAMWMTAALAVVATGTLGDLVESMFKRSYDVKDSGNILPGHGGILDRFDAVFIAAPFYFAVIYLLKP